MLSTNSIKTCGCQYQLKQLIQDFIFNSNVTEGLTPHVATMHLTHSRGREQKNYTTRLAKPFPFSYIPLLAFKYTFLATQHVPQRKPAGANVI
jgi:hypothetical protein